MLRRPPQQLILSQEGKVLSDKGTTGLWKLEEAVIFPCLEASLQEEPQVALGLLEDLMEGVPVAWSVKIRGL